MMATIRKRGSRYQVQIRRKGCITLSKSFATKTEALAWARLMDVEADKGALCVSRKKLEQYTVGDIIERYGREITVKKRSANSEIYIVKAFLKTSVAALTLKQVTTAHFSQYREQRLKRVKAGTVNRELQIVKHAFDLAEREWDIPLKTNPLLVNPHFRVRVLSESSGRDVV